MTFSVLYYCLKCSHITFYFYVSDALVFQIIQGPLSIIGGIGFGVLWGVLAKYVPEKQDVSSVSCNVIAVTAVLGRSEASDWLYHNL